MNRIEQREKEKNNRDQSPNKYIYIKRGYFNKEIKRKEQNYSKNKHVVNKYNINHTEHKLQILKKQHMKRKSYVENELNFTEN